MSKLSETLDIFLKNKIRTWNFIDQYAKSFSNSLQKELH